MPAKKSRRQPAKRPFEAALDELQQIVDQLEGGSLPLTESLEKYERGVACLKECHQALSQARKKVQTLVRLDEDGQAITEDFDDSPSDEVTRGVRRSSSVAEDDSDVEDDFDEESEEDSLF